MHEKSEHQVIETPVLIIVGPTASGKTDLSFNVAHAIHAEIINGDVGQFYQPLTIGTAKPLPHESEAPLHLFDIIKTPSELSVVAYQKKLTGVVSQIAHHGAMPIIVGGSFFYIKSLFYEFPSIDSAAKNFDGKEESDGSRQLYADKSTTDLWEMLRDIDPVRAEQIHPNDRYRVVRALAIWQTTKRKPSENNITFKPLLKKSLMVYLDIPKDVLNERIAMRTKIMFQQGWLEEVRALMGTPWELFLEQKGLIGYPEIIAWLRAGEDMATFDDLVATIVYKTTQYAKRQKTFAKKFLKQLEEKVKILGIFCRIKTIQSIGSREIEDIVSLCEDMKRN